MHTLYDFVTHIKIVEYLIAISCIALYIVYWEALKPKPFQTVAAAAKDDLTHIRETGGALKTIGKIAAAPFIGLAYVAILPFSFLFAIGSAAVNGLAGAAGREASFGWSPVASYLTGRKRKKDEKKKDEKTEEK
jgi:hypothetical protein